MIRLINAERKARIERILKRMRTGFVGQGSVLISRTRELFGQIDLIRFFTKEKPPLAITHIQSPALLVLMGGTLVRQYEQAGQLGRLASSLERHARYFRSVVLMTNDRSDYTAQFSSERVRHLRTVVPMPPGRAAPLLLSALLRFRSVRQATSVLILDEEAAPAGWMASRLSGSAMSMSVGAPSAPPRNPDVGSKRHWLVRHSLERVSRVTEWPSDNLLPATGEAERFSLPPYVDTDLYCPLTTTDPARPRTVGVFIGVNQEADARVILGVAEKLLRRRQSVVVRVFVIGHGAEARAAALQGEARDRDIQIEFQQLPPTEMRPDALARMRMCVAFSGAESVLHLLRAMASGVPGIAVAPRAGKAQPVTGESDWTDFVLKSGPTEEEITSSIETLFREPGVRLRMAREGRRFVIATHSIDALASQESIFVRGADVFTEAVDPIESEFDPSAEAEKLAQMLELVGVSRTAPKEASELEAAA